VRRPWGKRGASGRVGQQYRAWLVGIRQTPNNRQKDLLELKDGFLYELFHWAEHITGCRVESIKVRGAWWAMQCVPRCLQITECGLRACTAHWRLSLFHFVQLQEQDLNFRECS
jgi:hypothetical protein